MALDANTLRRAAEVIGGATSLRDAASLWRACDPGVRVMLADAMDMREETPALRLGHRRVYLASTNGHCWSVTQQPAEASALILTQVD